MKRALIVPTILLLAGCTNDPPPIRMAEPIKGETVTLAPFSPPSRPEKSDPAAAKLVADAVKAHIGTDGATVAKLKSVSLHRTGLTTTPDGARAPLDFAADFFAPGRYHAEITLKHSWGLESLVIVVTPDAGSIATAGQPQTKRPIQGDTLQDCHTQRIEDEFFLIYPLADASTVAAPAPSITLDGVEQPGVYVWTPAISPALVHFDKTTGRIARVVYKGRENNTVVLKQITVRECARFDSVWLVSKFELRTNGRLFLDVDKQTYEIGKLFDPARFVP